MFRRDCLCGHPWATHGWRWQSDSACAGGGCRCVTYQPPQRREASVHRLLRRLRGAA